MAPGRLARVPSHTTQETGSPMVTSSYLPFTIYGEVFKLLCCHSPQDRHPTTPHRPIWVIGLAFSVFGRPYSRNHVCFLFLFVLKCFTSEGSRSQSDLCGVLARTGSSHSEIPGSKSTSVSPGHISGCPVLHQSPNQGIHLTGVFGR